MVFHFTSAEFSFTLASVILLIYIYIDKQLTLKKIQIVQESHALQCISLLYME